MLVALAQPANIKPNLVSILQAEPLKISRLRHSLSRTGKYLKQEILLRSLKGLRTSGSLVYAITFQRPDVFLSGLGSVKVNEFSRTRDVPKTAKGAKNDGKSWAVTCATPKTP
ncbi:MAG: hypothetical protein ACLFNU_03600 [Bacteroidales bacterium]